MINILRSHLLLIIIILIACFLRLSNLDVLSLWMDEYIHVSRVISFLKGESGLLGGDNNGIFYTISVLPWFFIFDSSEFFARLPAALYGILSVPLLWAVARKWYGNEIGVLSALLLTLSTYHVFWSRVSRNYTIYLFFILLLVYLLTIYYEKKEHKYLIGAIIVSLLSVLSHALTIIFIITIFLWNSIQQFRDRNFSLFGSFQIAIGILIILYIFTPFADALKRDILGLFLPERGVGMIMIDWNRLWALTNETPLVALDTYLGVIRLDYKYLYFIALIGVIGGAYHRKLNFFHAFIFFINLFLISFIYREPNLPRYFIYLYPFYLIFIAMGFHFITTIIATKWKSSAKPLFLSGLLVIAIASSFQDLKNLALGANKTGFIVDRAFAHWAFTNWKDVYRASESRIHDDDLIMSTVSSSANYYLNRDDVIWFRQVQFDGQIKGYKKNEDTGSNRSAWSLNDLIKTVEENDRGWLFVDYYFYNVLTDPAARMFVYQNFHFHPEFSKDGDVQVFSWDKSLGKPAEQSFVVELGKGRFVSESFFLNIPSLPNSDNARFLVRIKGVDSNQEAFISFNSDRNTVAISKNTTSEPEWIEINVPKQYLKQGSNEIKFWYNNRILYDGYRGFIAYNLR